MREIYFYAPDGNITLLFYAVGEVTEPDIPYYCLPADSIWFMTLPLCGANLWYDAGCSSIRNPLGVDELSIEDVDITFPNRLNGYQLIAELEDKIERLTLYDLQGRKSGESYTNSIDCI